MLHPIPSAASSFIVERRYSGPPNCGNGGYVAGRLATLLGAPQARISLLRPTPLDTPLRVETRAEGGLALMDGDQAVITAEADDTPIEVPQTLVLNHALAGQPPRQHPFPGCFVCGPNCKHGLHIFPERVDSGMCAARWTPAATLSDIHGHVRPEFLYAALDCPGAFAALGGVVDRPIVLGRFTVRLDRRPPVGMPLTVAAWTHGQEGRKHAVATALYDRQGDLVAASCAIWIELRQQAAA